jgi:hypothetical protein
VVDRVISRRDKETAALPAIETRPVQIPKVVAEPPAPKSKEAAAELPARSLKLSGEHPQTLVQHAESIYEVEVRREPQLSAPDIATALEPPAPAPRERKIETVVEWPQQEVKLNPAERATVRMEVERQARGRVAADPRAKSLAAQKLEIRVEQVNVRFEAPAASRPLPPQTNNDNPFSGFFRARSLR